MKYLLDSNAVIALLTVASGLLTRLRQCRPEDVGLSSIVLHELVYGACRSQRREQNLARMDALQFEVSDFGRQDAHAAGERRAGLATTGRSIGALDVLIAGQAVARDLTLVTYNTPRFRRVPRLLWEDWRAA